MPSSRRKTIYVRGTDSNLDSDLLPVPVVLNILREQKEEMRKRHGVQLEAIHKEIEQLEALRKSREFSADILRRLEAIRKQLQR